MMIKTTEETLKEIGVDNIPMVVALNKADKMDIAYPTREGDNLIMAATDQPSLKELANIIKEKVFKDYQTRSLLIPFDKGDIVSYLNDNTTILKTDYRENGTVVTAELNSVDAKRFEKYLLPTE
jgi:GTP-binding protein HflX